MKGFTLVETLIAIAVLTLAVVGPFTVVQGVLQSSYIARDQLVASALAQEGLEYVRSVRDSNFIYNYHNAGNRSWLYGFDGSTGVDCYTHACVVDVSQQTTADCGSTSCAAYPLYMANPNSSPTLYTQVTSGNTLTRFTRTVRFTSISATESLVTITVSWTSHGPHSVVLTEDLRNWL